MLTRSHIVRGPVVCSAHECSQQGRWLLDWSRFGQCCHGVSRTSCPVVVSRVQTLHLAQLGNLTYDQTNDISKGNLETIDLDGALWIAVVCGGVRPVSVRCAASVTYSNPCLWSRDKNEKTNQLCDGDCLKNAMATTYCGMALCSVWNPWCGQFAG